ncbi:Lrp/AsnC family transcriptional regulator [Roseomonas sp. BN140053]|uniref:Lrp/AsnC family transcriptional regulator n=1 Tax=Roseomonas sp. BN140053 TaxID=3391898 RepID=UPI0039EC20D8
MDEIDRNILIALQQDGAAGLADLAKVAGLSVSATAERVKRLEERGTIRGWRADLDPAAVGCPLVGWALVSLRPGQDDEAFRDAMLRAEAVLECHAITGAWSFMVKLRLPDLPALERFVAGQIGALPGVERTQTVVAMATVKETSILPVADADEE